jgi:signal transduction histidine kinase
MICYLSSNPLHFIFSQDVPALLYYSHVPTAIIAMLVGFFVLLSGKKLLANRLLFTILTSFSLWVISNLILWTNIHSDFMLFIWSFLMVLSSIISVLGVYFIYVFLEKRDVSLFLKSIFLILIVPIIVLSPTHANLSGFNITSCDAFMFEGFIFRFSNVFFGALAMIWILFLLIHKYRKAEVDFKKQIILMGIGMESFLFFFFMVTFLAAYLTDMGILSDSRLEFYGLLGMTFFVGVLAYLIVEYKAFNIKMLGVQALVGALVVLVGSQFFFVHDKLSFILTGITLILSSIFGYWIIKSVKNEIAQKEILALSNKEISERKEQLQKMADSLAIANDKLRKLDNAKTEFISIASHQLRTPITAIKGFVSLILEGSYGEIGIEAKNALGKVYLSSERLVALIEDLLNVSRIESGRMTFEFEKASVEKLLRELYDSFILVAKKKNFYLDLKLPTQALPEITMDHAKVRELVSNFIDNALKYTEKGGVTIKAEVMEEGVLVDENGFVIPGRNSGFGDVIRISVADTGIGVGRDEIPYLFRKFSRGKDVSRLHVSGTGLGLYVGKAIATAHHGQVWVESDGVGTGSRFMIEIPIEVV